MRKKLLAVIIASLAVTVGAFALSGCNQNPESDNQGGNPGEHTSHTFNQEVAEDKYLASEATCTKKATYYYSCSCGEKGTKTFEYGDFNHIFEGGKCKNCQTLQPTEGLKYILSSHKETYTVGLGTATQANIVIADSYNGKPVTDIGYNAFYNCSGLTSILIPNSVTSICDDAFSGCSGLTSITIPDGVTSIGNRAFYGCEKLQYNIYDNAFYLGNETNKYVALVQAKDQEITTCEINEKTKVICNSAFYGCSRLESITVGENNTAYASQDGIIYNKAKTKIINIPKAIKGAVTIPDGVTSIGDRAFEDRSGLTSIIIPNSVTSIGHSAFYNCSGLESITISDGVTSIGGSAFFGCKKLQYNIYDNAFYLGNETNKYVALMQAKNQAITTCTINDSTNIISDYAFDGCSGLTSITIPDSVTSIGGWAFDDCSGLTSIIIPDSVTYIGTFAFNGCSGLESITIPDSVTNIREYAFYGCSGLTSITIPDSVTRIGYRAFDGCSKLESITIPDSVTYIGTFAFNGCSGLKTIYCEAESQPSGWHSWKSNCDAEVVWGYKGD